MASKTEQLLNNIKELTVIELAELTKMMEEEFGVTAAMPVAAGAPAAGAAAAAEPAAEKSEYKVELSSIGDEKIKVIKALRKVKKDLGLTEAKKMVEEAQEAPTVLAEAAPKEEAEAMKKELEEAGATVKLS